MLEIKAPKAYLTAFKEHGIEWELIPPGNHTIDETWQNK
jgi:hypothetical protein